MSTLPTQPPAAASDLPRAGTPGRAMLAAGTPPFGTMALPHNGHDNKRLWALALGALGVVFGDIGTSPLYTLKECLHSMSHGTGKVTGTEVLEILSLIFWSLTMVVTVKYLIFIMKADNRGEGGVFALLALVPEKVRSGPTQRVSLVALLVVIGSSFLYGDGAITPAISVVGAVEGIAYGRPDLQAYVLPITLGLLVALFALQSRGTALLGALFGPVMTLWFGTLAVLGGYQIIQNPSVLMALSPHYAVRYFIDHGSDGITILASVVLAVTGGEALYADMGHFGLKPIRLGWFAFVMPSLVIAYFGQGALVMAHPEAVENPFFAMVPAGGAQFALVLLSSAAAIIASQALISGSYSLTRQAMQLGFFPRVTIRHTAHEQEGQIYIPEINALLAAVCIMLVLFFKTSANLAATYGVAVTGTMTLTSLIFAFVVWRSKGWAGWKAVSLLLVFLAFDLPFVFANLSKIRVGGYVPLLLGLGVIVVMLVWHEGRRLIAEVYLDKFSSFEEAWPVLEKKIAVRTPGTGIFMASTDRGVPPILVHHVERTRALHRQILLLTVITTDAPKVPPSERLSIQELGHGFYRVHAYFGFMEQPDVPRALRLAVVRKDIDFDLREVTYYLARERILANAGGKMGSILEGLFGFLQRNAVNADRYFRIPPEQVVEVGAQIDL